MQALYWDGRILRVESSRPTPATDQETVLVRVHLAGICSTDLQIFKGYMGFRGVPGHEFVGTVSEGPRELLGKRVVGEINFPCGHCDYCNRGLERHCPKRSVMGILNADGAFAEFAAVPVANLHVVPDGVSDEEAVFTDPLATAVALVHQCQAGPAHDSRTLADGHAGHFTGPGCSLSGRR